VSEEGKFNLVDLFTYFDMELNYTLTSSLILRKILLLFGVCIDDSEVYQIFS